MGESTSAKRQVKPWVIAVVLASAVVVFGGIWYVVSLRKMDREFVRPDGHAVRHGKAWTRANGLCRRLNMVGNRYAIRGMYDSALTCYREVLRVAQEEGLADRMAAAYNNISNVFDYLCMPESVRFYMNAASALDQLSRKPGKVMNSLFEQGTFQLSALGNYDSATVLLEKALAESQTKGDTIGMAAALCNLGTVQMARKHYDSAEVLLEGCAQMSRVVKDAASEAMAFNNLAMLSLKRDRPQEAKSWLLKAVEAAHAADVIGQEAPALFYLALIRAGEGDYELAQINVEQALRLYERAGDRDGTRRCRDYRDELVNAQRWRERSKSCDSLIDKHKPASPGS
jgi:tetratricopeptide (TPR) repeat protein